MTRSWSFLLPIGLAMLAACVVTPEQRVRRALVDAGIQPPVASCMAGKMTRKLSIAQLRELQAAVKEAKGEDGHASLKSIKRQLRTLDPLITFTVTRAAISCEIADG